MQRDTFEMPEIVADFLDIWTLQAIASDIYFWDVLI